MRIKKPLFLTILQTAFCISHQLLSNSGEISELQGAISIHLEAGSPDTPSFLVTSSSLKGEAVFRGQVKETADNNISFYQVPNLLDPDELQAPFKAGILASIKARAGNISLDSNGSLSSISLEFNGSSYLAVPEVFVDLPTSGTSSSTDFKQASIEAVLDSSTGVVSSLLINDGGLGYQNPPKITIEGGFHFIRLAEKIQSTLESFSKF